MTEPPRVFLRAPRSDGAGAVALQGRCACLFIDVDGTLLEFIDQPEAVPADRDLIELMRQLLGATQGAVALISGRAIHALDTIFAPLRLPAAGLHGLERRGADNLMHRPIIHRAQLKQARELLTEVTRLHPGLHLEDKEHSLALHYRRAPQAALYARHAVDAALAPLRPDFELLCGAQVLEIKPASHTKGSAVEAFIREAPFASRLPVYLGDDVTDLDGFETVRRHGGVDIAVGTRVGAQWNLAGPAAVREWLTNLLRAEDGAA